MHVIVFLAKRSFERYCRVDWNEPKNYLNVCNRNFRINFVFLLFILSFIQINGFFRWFGRWFNFDGFFYSMMINSLCFKEKLFESEEDDLQKRKKLAGDEPNIHKPYIRGRRQFVHHTKQNTTVATNSNFLASITITVLTTQPSQQSTVITFPDWSN